MENVAGYLASGLIGLSLGLIGSGGSIVTIPVLVYLFHIEPSLATAYSLFIVGTTSLVGSIRSAANKTVDVRSAVLFSVPSTLAIYLTRHYLLPHIPDRIFLTDQITLTKSTGIMIFFSLIMIVAATRMIMDKRGDEWNRDVNPRHFFMILLQGFLVGTISGIVGAGGGFMIIPALVLLAGLPMKKAIGTSLVIVTVNSVIGFFGDVQSIREINFPFMLLVTSVAIAGVFLGSFLTRFVHSGKLKSGFGWFTLAIAAYVMVKEILL